MRSIFEKINIIFLGILILFVGFNVYLNLSGYANPQRIIDTLKSDYLYSIPSRDVLNNGQLKGLVEQLGDPYAQYIPESEVQAFNDSLNQRYQGIGVTFSFRNMDEITVTQVFSNSPAEKAGVQNGDILLTINTEPVTNKSQENIISSIRGDEGSSVTLQFARNNNGVIEKYTTDIVRARVDIDLVELEVVQNQAMITIRSFGDTVLDEFISKARQITENRQIDTIIINLMNNPGGRLDHAISIISTFLSNPDTVVLYERTKHEEIALKSTKQPIDLSSYNVKIVQNENSASASEIVAASLRELKAVRIYGRTSFGKGVVQKVRELPDRSLLKYTVAEWLTPEKKSIDKVGVRPDKEYGNDISFESAIFDEPTE